MKKILFVMLFLLIIPGIASAEEDIYEDSFEEIAGEDIYDGIPDVELDGTAGMTPDSTFYFMETMFEDIMVGDDPETALKYKEEKLLEAEEMIRSGNKEAAEKALKRVNKYNDILKKQVTPELDERVRKSSKATKSLLSSLDSEMEGDEWGDVKEIIDDNIKNEDKIALASKVSKKIESLCIELSTLDPLEYSKMCKTDNDAPEWKKKMDRKLTGEQEKVAREFFNIMSDCFEDPANCRCNDISVKPFAEQCNIIAPLAAKCEAGNEEACKEMENVEDPIGLLPDYLQEVMGDVEDRYGEAKHDMHVPAECVEEGALTKEACMKVMFKIHSPPECQEALENGKIDPKNEREARAACEEIIFDLEAPPECKDAGLKDRLECERFLFKLDAPSECLDAGLTGSGKNDWKKCDAIKFRLDAPQECLDAGLNGEGRDDWRKCEIIRFKLDAPEECLDAGLTGSGRDDWRKCEAIKFRTEAHPACLEAGLTGERQNDWRECQRIQFKAEAPEECLEAGLDGSGRNDWDECNRIREVTEDQWPRREDCGRDQLHIFEDGSYYCIDKEDYDRKHNDPYQDCGAVDCQQGYRCEYGNCVPEGGYIESECKDGCSDECPGASRTNCVKDMCECYYDDPPGDDNNPPGFVPFDNPDRSVTDGKDAEVRDTSGSDGSTTDAGSGDTGSSDTGSSEHDSGTASDSGGSTDTGGDSVDGGSKETDSGSDTSETKTDSADPEPQ